MITEEEFKFHYYRGCSDSEISRLTNTSRKQISKIRNNLQLPIMSLTTFHGEKIKYFVEKGYSDIRISNKLHISKSMVGYIRKRLKIKTNFIERSYKTNTDRRKGYIIRNLKASAKKRNLEFALDYHDLELPKYCPILGIELNYKNSSQEYNHPTVDRINNSKGYIKGNIIIMSRLANAMKNQATFSELKTFSKNILKLINYYENQGALGNITDIFPNTELYEET